MTPKEKPKRPYKPPTIRTERVYERRSLACGKTNPVMGMMGCAAGRQRIS